MFPDRHRDIARCLDQVLREGVSTPGPEPCSIEYRTFSLDGSPFETTNPSALEREIARQYVQQEVGFPIEHVLMVFRPFHGAIVVAVESTQPDKVMDGIVRQLKRLAKEQLSGKRPSLICVRFSDITEEELLEIAEADRAGQASSLQRATSMLLSRDDWRHVHTIAYFTPGHLVISNSASKHTRTTMVQESGASYLFKNPHHELASDSRLMIF